MGLLNDYSVPVPPNLYTTTLANGGSMRNRGIEVMLSGSPVKLRDFTWTTTVTASRNVNKILSLSNDLYETNNYLNTAYAGDPISLPTHRLEVGKPVGYYWGMKSVGVSDDGLWMIQNPSTKEAETFNSGMVSGDDYRQWLGNGYPKIYLGWNNAFQYKQFDLNVQMTGQFGFKILNQQRMFYENNSIQYNRLKSAAKPVYGVRTLSNSQTQTFVSYYLEKGDFLKFDNVTLGYTPQVFQNYIAKMRIYVSAQNFLIITGYKGLDPELSNSDYTAAGNDARDKYPTIRSFTLGVNVTFK